MRGSPLELRHGRGPPREPALFLGGEGHGGPPVVVALVAGRLVRPLAPRRDPCDQGLGLFGGEVGGCLGRLDLPPPDLAALAVEI